MNISRDDRREDRQKSGEVGKQGGPEHAPAQAAFYDRVIERGGNERRNDAERIGQRQQHDLMEIDIRLLAERGIHEAEQPPEERDEAERRPEEGEDEEAFHGEVLSATGFWHATVPFNAVEFEIQLP